MVCMKQRINHSWKHREKRLRRNTHAPSSIGWDPKGKTFSYLICSNIIIYSTYWQYSKLYPKNSILYKIKITLL